MKCFCGVKKRTSAVSETYKTPTRDTFIFLRKKGSKGDCSRWIGKLFERNDLDNEKSIIASADEVVYGDFEEDAEFYKDIVVGLIASDLPTRDRGF